MGLLGLLGDLLVPLYFWLFWGFRALVRWQLLGFGFTVESLGFRATPNPTSAEIEGGLSPKPRYFALSWNPLSLSGGWDALGAPYLQCSRMFCSEKSLLKSKGGLTRANVLSSKPTRIQPVSVIPYAKLFRCK